MFLEISKKKKHNIKFCKGFTCLVISESGNSANHFILKEKKKILSKEKLVKNLKLDFIIIKNGPKLCLIDLCAGDTRD